MLALNMEYLAVILALERLGQYNFYKVKSSLGYRLGFVQKTRKVVGIKLNCSVSYFPLLGDKVRPGSHDRHKLLSLGQGIGWAVWPFPDSWVLGNGASHSPKPNGTWLYHVSLDSQLAFEDFRL